jgi:plastocyanin
MLTSRKTRNALDFQYASRHSDHSGSSAQAEHHNSMIGEITMKRLVRFSIFAILLTALAIPGGAFAGALTQSSAPQTYTVLVGFENVQQGYDVMSFFPNVVTVHVGDSVHWKINSNEIHTVSFGYAQDAVLPDFLVPAEALGYPASPSPLIVNPAAADQFIPNGGQYTGGAANSGIMGREEGTVQDFELTFPEPGTYLYVCLVHGWVMSGTVVVKAVDERVPSPQQSTAQGNQEMAQALAKVPEVRKAAKAQVKPDVQNPDGSTTHYVLLGYSDGAIDVLQFFPDKVKVSPGDTVVWEMSPKNDAPHTVTFLNGAPAPGLFIPVPQPSGPPLIYIDPGTLFPYEPGPELMRSGAYNSGVALPIPGPFYSLKIGDMTPGLQPFVCLLHDESGMTGVLMVTPK